MPNENPDWLVMVYMSADGVLANFAVESLKQLQRAATNDVVVVAQMETDGIVDPKQYVFDGSNSAKPLSDIERAPASQSAAGEAPNVKDLRKFIANSVGLYSQAKHHALFLWGHGPELLSNEGPRSEAEAAEERKNPNKPIETRYLTPSQLRDALNEIPFAKPDQKLDIIGLDACSMSMAELASELGDYVQFMVASQDDVPDQSFPYGAILPRLQALTSAKDASTAIPEVYLEAYSDYITDPRTAFREFTLSTVDLASNKIARLTAALTKLASLLLELSKNNKQARGKILEARMAAQGFVFGLFVDIVDLCDKLEASMSDNAYLNLACDELRQAVTEAVINTREDKGTADGKAERAPGLSIYFPYRIPDPTEQLQELRKGTGVFPKKERTQRIHELERDFAGLQRFIETGWMKFIQEGWSAILTELAAEEAKKGRLILDEIYSAQQCAQNLGSVGQYPNGSARSDWQPPVTSSVKPSVVEMPASSEQPPAVNQ